MNDTVARIKERLSILDVISPYVELHKAGKNYKGRSPFTNEKTPSFYVSPDRGMYYCFSSNQGGDIFTFVEKMEGVDFKGALKVLAEKAGIELVPEDPKKRSERETQYALIEEATKYFFKCREDHADADSYVKGRGVEGKTIHVWRIGFAPDAWRALKAHLMTMGFKEADMLRAGLIKEAEGGKESYDVFRNRIMFPIMDSSGRVVAFSGRTLSKEEGIPKYVNSPETELFQKSDILFGYDKAKDSIRKYDFSLLVEGQFDLVLAHQAGYGNAVAVSGTALTEHHVELLQRLSNRAVLALDADRAGISAMKRASGIMLKRGMDVKVVRIEGGKDPADVIREDAGAFKKMVGNAEHVIPFFLTVLKATTKDDRAYKLSAREELIPLLAVMPNHIDREHFEGIVASALETTKDAIHYEVERATEKGTKAPIEAEVVREHHFRKPINDHPVFFASVLTVAKSGHPEITSWLTERIEMLSLDTNTPLETCIATDEAVINEYIFTHKLDEWLEREREKAIKEKLADALTHYHRARLTETKHRLDSELANVQGDDGRAASLLAEINTVARRRSSVSYGIED